MKSNLPDGAQHELDFWKGFIKTPQFATWLADGPTPELEMAFVNFIKPLVDDGAQVLDVASGVVSVLHGLIPDVQLTTTDLLADQYAGIFPYDDHETVVIPLPIAAENLSKLFMYGGYDIAHIRNGLDHCQDVRLAFAQLFGAVKPGGYVIVQGFENEADAEKWQGFHQTNLFLPPGANLIQVQTKTDRYSLNHPDLVKCTHFLRTLENGKSWFIWIGKKKEA